MGLGVLEDSHLEQVPGTAYRVISRLTTTYVIDDAARRSDDPDDPLVRRAPLAQTFPPANLRRIGHSGAAT
jgi:hypothetical protein